MNKHLTRVIFNPEMDHAYFYPFLKSLVLLYDEIILWQPAETRFASDREINDFIALLAPIEINGRPVTPIRPAGREGFFFDKANRDAHGLEEFRRKVSTPFLAAISADPLISFYSTRQHVRTYALSLLNGSETAELWRERALDIYRHMNIPDKPDVFARMMKNAGDQGISVEWANFQEFMMDTFVKNDLSKSYKISIDKLIIDRDHWSAYSVIDDVSREELSNDEYLKNAIDDGKIEWINSDPQIREFFEHFYYANHLTVDELISYKKRIGPQVRAYLSEKRPSLHMKSLITDTLAEQEGIYRFITNNIGRTVAVGYAAGSVAGSLLGDGAPSEVVPRVAETMKELDDLGMFRNTIFRYGSGLEGMCSRLHLEATITASSLFWRVASLSDNDFLPHYPLLSDTFGFREGLVDFLAKPNF